MILYQRPLISLTLFLPGLNQLQILNKEHNHHKFSASMRMYSIDLHCKILLDIIPISLYVGYRVNTLYIFSYFQNFSWKE